MKLPDVEWSGVLFYEVSGEFGEPGFSIVARELYLQDIGSSAYTEYETNDPEFYKILMERPDLRAMRMGHIHSHNTMDSFFSGTDDSELSENSEFHNYYFSLIVNNDNEMVGKVAFRAEVDSQITSQMTYKGTDGQLLYKKINSETRSTYLYIYKCDITVPDIVTQTLGSVEQQEDRKEQKKTKRYIPSSTYNGDLFESDQDIFSSQREDSNEGEDRGQEQGQMGELGMDYSMDYRDGDRTLDRKSIDFLIKLLMLDEGATGKVEDVLEQAVRDMYRSGNVEEYYEKVSDKLPFLYLEVFPDDHSLKRSDDVLYDCMEALDLYRSKYPVFTDRMQKILHRHTQQYYNE